MAVEAVRVRRRAAGGAAGAPGSLLNAEVAFNEQDNTLYYGRGSGAGGVSQTIIPIAGPGAFVDRTQDQDIGGVKNFTTSPLLPTPSGGGSSQRAVNIDYLNAQLQNLGAGDMLRSIYDTTSNGVVDNSERLGGELPAYYAPIVSPAFTGTPTAPTPTPGTNSQQLATTAYVLAAIATLINSAPGALDQLNELAAAIGNDPNFAATLTNQLALKLAIANNLSDLQSASAARGNLGLGTMSVQDANAVAITGGTIDGVIIDGGTF